MFGSDTKHFFIFDTKLKYINNEEKMSNKNIIYTRNYIDTVNTISPITSQFIFENKDGQVKLRGNNESGNCLFLLNAPKENLNFTGDEDNESKLCFLDFTKFFKLYKEFDKPNDDKTKEEHAVLDIEINDNTNEAVVMNVKSNKSPCNFKYRLANTDVIKKPIIKENPKLPEFVASINLSKEMVNVIMHRISMIDANYVTFELNEKTCKFIGKNNITNQEYSEEIALDTEVDKPLKVTIKAEAFTLLPTADYLVNFSEQFLTRFEQQRADGIDLTLFLTAVKSEN